MEQIAQSSTSVVRSREMTSERGRAILDRIKKAMATAVLINIPVDEIRRMEGQPRKNFDPARIRTLAVSIGQSGQMMPGIVRRISEDPFRHIYELCDGERRWRAVKEANVPTYRALVIDLDAEAAQYVISIISNFNREGHTVLELVDAIVEMKDRLMLTESDISENIALGQNRVSQLYGLRRLDPLVRDMLDPNLTKRPLPVGAAIEISGLPKGLQLPIAKRIMDGVVKTRFIKREIQKISRENNLNVRVRTAHPSDKRRSIELRIETLNDSSVELHRALSASDAPRALEEWPLAKLEELQKLLVEGAEKLTGSYELLEAAASKKKGTIVRSRR